MSTSNTSSGIISWTETRGKLNSAWKITQRNVTLLLVTLLVTYRCGLTCSEDRRHSRTSEARGLGGPSVLEVAYPRFLHMLEAVLEGIHCSRVDDPLVQPIPFPSVYHSLREEDKNSSEDEIANVNVLRRHRTCRGQSLRPLNWVPNFYYNYASMVIYAPNHLCTYAHYTELSEFVLPK